MNRRAKTAVAALVGALVSALALPAGASDVPQAPQVAGLTSAYSSSISAQRLATAPAAPTSHASSFEVQVNDLAPRVFTNEAELTVSGSVYSAEAQEDVTLNVYVRSDSMVTVPEALRYLDNEGRSGTYVLSEKIGELKAGKTRDFSLKIPAGNLPLNSSFFWGPRGLEVRASAGQEEAFDRTLLVWDSGYEVQPTKLSVVSPVAKGVENTDEGVRSTYPTSDTVDVMRKLAGIDGVTLAADATLLNDRGFVTELASTHPAPIISLPSTDADVAGIAHLTSKSEITQLVKDSKSKNSLDAATDGGLDVLDAFVLPKVTGLDKEVTGVWADQTIIAVDPSLRPSGILTYDPSAWSRYNASTGEAASIDEDGVDVLVAHSQLSSLFAEDADSEAEELDIQQLIRSTTAIVTRQLPNRARTLLALTPRNADEGVLSERVNAALGERWVEPISAGDVIEESDAPTERTTLPESLPTPGAITDKEIKQLYAAIESTAAMASAMEDSTGIVSEQRSRLLLATALPLREQPEVRVALIAGVNAEAQALSTSVKVEQSAPINLLDRTARLPVRVSSTFNEPVDTVVELQSSDPRLQIVERVNVHVPANSSTVAEIPVRAVGSGNVTVRVVVKGPNGLVIDDATKLQVRVRAQWESNGMVVLAIFLGLLVVVGVWRTIRNGRRMEPKVGRHQDPHAKTDKGETKASEDSSQNATTSKIGMLEHDSIDEADAQNGPSDANTEAPQENNE